MDAARAPQHGERLRWSPRTLCIIAGLLCTVGVLSGTMLRSAEAHHHRVFGVAAVVTVADTHGALRADQHVVATAPASVAQSRVRLGLVAAEATSVDVVTIDSVRTRGPPALV